MVNIRDIKKGGFSRQFLNDHRVEIFRGEKQILDYSLPKRVYNIKLPNTRYYVGDKFIEEGEPIKITSYLELLDLGYCVNSRKVKKGERWETGQSVVYDLKPRNNANNPLETFPKGKYAHHVMYNPYGRQLQLIGPRAGPNDFGPVINMNESGYHSKGGKSITFKGYRTKAEELIENRFNKWSNAEEELEPINIPEAAFMITDNNEIVCFPRTNDMPSILISGLKRSGKSYCSHSIISRLFWKPLFDYKIAILNDSSRETGPWSQPNKDEQQIKDLARLNEKPLPLPIVYLHPSVKEDYEKLHMGNTGFDITIPFVEIVERHEEYMQIEGSARYLTSLKDELKRCKSEKEVEMILEQITFTHSVPPQTATKIRAEFQTLFDTGMTDISYEEQKPWWTSKNPDRTYNPLTACLHAGLLPVLETEYVSNDPKMLSKYFTYFVKDLFMRQKQDTDFVAEQSEILLVIDEAHNISSGNAIISGADKLLRRCVREGGPRRVGTLLTTQKFTELPSIIKDNSTYLICFKNPGEASKIANQYKMGSAAAKMITNLEKHECIAYTTEYFIVYDSQGNQRRSKANELFRGKTLPPYSMHKKPRGDDD